MKSECQSPSAWSSKEVVMWATDEHLAKEVVKALETNQCDGAKLLSMTEESLQMELAIESQPARQHMLELLESLKVESLAFDFAVALKLHEEEIKLISMENMNPGARKSETEVVSQLEEDAQKHRQLMTDHLLAHRLQRSLDLGGSAIYENLELARQEQNRLNQLAEQVNQDRAYALGLRDGRPAARNSRVAALPATRSLQVQSNLKSPPQTPVTASSNATAPLSTQLKPSASQAQTVSRFGQLKMAPRSVPPAEEKQEQKPPPPNLPLVAQCAACYTEKTQGYKLACKHSQCVSCMTKLFRTALKDSSLLPLRCCEKPIDMIISRQLLKGSEAATLQNRALEREAKNRLYCPTCGKFHNLDQVVATASNILGCDCGARLCLICKTLEHPSTSCATNQAAQRQNNDAILTLSQTMGWKQCPTCNTMIELRHGCNHMTCASCRHEFCFRCLKPWSTRSGNCSSGVCSLWDENRLLEAGEMRVQREERVLGVALAPAVREDRIRAAVRGLRANEICVHEWRRSHGYKGDCPNCSFTMWAYGMRCASDCESVVCYTCAHHRIPQRGWR